MEIGIGNMLLILMERIFGNLDVVLEQIFILSQHREDGIVKIQSPNINFLDSRVVFCLLRLQNQTTNQ